MQFKLWRNVRSPHNSLDQPHSFQPWAQADEQEDQSNRYSLPIFPMIWMIQLNEGVSSSKNQRKARIERHPIKITLDLEQQWMGASWTSFVLKPIFICVVSNLLIRQRFIFSLFLIPSYLSLLSSLAFSCILCKAVLENKWILDHNFWSNDHQCWSNNDFIHTHTKTRRSYTRACTGNLAICFTQIDLWVVDSGRFLFVKNSSYTWKFGLNMWCRRWCSAIRKCQ